MESGHNFPLSLYRIFKSTSQRVSVDILELKSCACFILLSLKQSSIFHWVGRSSKEDDRSMAESLVFEIISSDYPMMTVRTIYEDNEDEPIQQQTLAAFLELFQISLQDYRQRIKERQQICQNKPASLYTFEKVQESSLEYSIRLLCVSSVDPISGSVKKFEIRDNLSVKPALILVGSQNDIWIPGNFNRREQAGVKRAALESFLRDKERELMTGAGGGGGGGSLPLSLDLARLQASEMFLRCTQITSHLSHSALFRAHFHPSCAAYRPMFSEPRGRGRRGEGVESREEPEGFGSIPTLNNGTPTDCVSDTLCRLLGIPSSSSPPTSAHFSNTSHDPAPSPLPTSSSAKRDRVPEEGKRNSPGTGSGSSSPNSTHSSSSKAGSVRSQRPGTGKEALFPYPAGIQRGGSVPGLVLGGGVGMRAPLRGSVNSLSQLMMMIDGVKPVRGGGGGGGGFDKERELERIRDRERDKEREREKEKEKGLGHRKSVFSQPSFPNPYQDWPPNSSRSLPSPSSARSGQIPQQPQPSSARTALSPHPTPNLSKAKGSQSPSPSLSPSDNFLSSTPSRKNSGQEPGPGTGTGAGGIGGIVGLIEGMGLSIASSGPGSSLTVLASSAVALLTSRDGPRDSERDREMERAERARLSMRIRQMTEHVEFRPLNVSSPRPRMPLLVLDLDHTIIDYGARFHFPFHLLKRPFLDHFLTVAYRHFDLAVWSQTSWRWVKMKLEDLGLIKHKGYRFFFGLDKSSMLNLNNNYVKPLELIWARFGGLYGPHNTLHIDDLDRNFELNKGQGLTVKPFYLLPPGTGGRHNHRIQQQLQGPGGGPPLTPQQDEENQKKDQCRLQSVLSAVQKCVDSLKMNPSNSNPPNPSVKTPRPLPSYSDPPSDPHYGLSPLELSYLLRLCPPSHQPLLQRDSGDLGERELAGVRDVVQVYLLQALAFVRKEEGTRVGAEDQQQQQSPAPTLLHPHLPPNHPWNVHPAPHPHSAHPSSNPHSIPYRIPILHPHPSLAHSHPHLHPSPSPSPLPTNPQEPSDTGRGAEDDADGSLYHTLGSSTSVPLSNPFEDRELLLLSRYLERISSVSNLSSLSHLSWREDTEKWVRDEEEMDKERASQRGSTLISTSSRDREKEREANSKKIDSGGGGGGGVKSKPRK